MPVQGINFFITPKTFLVETVQGPEVTDIANVVIWASSDNTRALVLRRFSATAASNLLECQDQAGTTLFAINPSGGMSLLGNAVQTGGTSGAPTLGFFGATPIPRITTAVNAAAFVVNSGTAVNTGSTFDGYTIQQVVFALQLIGILT